MRVIPVIILISSLAVGCSYQGYDHFRRNTCHSIVDADERANCLEAATQSENAYKQDVEAATSNN